MSSDGDWGREASDEARELYDTWSRLPWLPEDNPALNNFLEKKALTLGDLSKVGVRWLAPDTLAYWFPGGVKYRSVVDGTRWSSQGATLTRCKVVRGTDGVASVIIVAEGETDAAAFLKHAPAYDVAILPAGARGINESMQFQLARYSTVLVATDNDEAGDDGYSMLRAFLPGCRRLRPPEGFNDWCDALKTGPPSSQNDWPESTAEAPLRRVFTAREVLTANLGDYKDNHWFAEGILPKRGLCVFNAAMKSGKSFVMYDMLRGLATGTAFAQWYDYLPSDGGRRVLLVQFEIPPFDYQQRLRKMVADIHNDEERGKFLDNFRVAGMADDTMPRLRAGESLMAEVLALVDEAEADVVAFDPLQRMTGGLSQDKSNEMDAVLDIFSELQSRGQTVVYAHHNNKAGANVGSAYSMTGTQRFGSDADAVCSLYRPALALPDDNDAHIKQRNFTWTLRSGAADGRSVTLAPNTSDPSLVDVTFAPPISNIEELTNNAHEGMF